MSCSKVQNEYNDAVVGRNYSITFEYEDEMEVHVAEWDPSKLQFDPVERDTWNFQNETTIRFTTAPNPGPFIIYRKTDLEEMEVTFYPGSSIRAQDLNLNFEQLQHALQELGCFKEEFYDYLDNYIWDVRDAYTREDQINGRAIPSDDKILTSAADAARHDVYLQDNTPAELPYEQGGKRWFDLGGGVKRELPEDKTSKAGPYQEPPNNYIWNDEIGAWIDYARTGPQGPRGRDGHHIVIMALKPPKKRPNGEPVCNGDIWFSTCTADTFIYYNNQWITLGNTGPRGAQGETGYATTIIGQKQPETRPDGNPLQNGDIWFNTCVMETFWYYNGTWLQLGSAGAKGDKGDTGTYHTICSLKAPTQRKDGGELQCGDIWFSTCTGDAFVWYDNQWLTFGSGGAKGKDGKDGATIWIGDFPPIDKEQYPLWYNTDCATQEGLYIWYDQDDVWVNTNTPGPKGDKGDAGGGGADFNAVTPIEYNPDTTDLTFDIQNLTILN